MLFGRGAQHLSRTLPGPLNGFAAATGMDALQVLARHTVFPYYAAFTSPAREVALRRRAFTGSRSPIKTALIGNTPTLPPSGSLHFCPECIEHAVAKYGVGFWKRTHQLPFVVLCPEHGCEIRKTRKLDHASLRTLHPAALHKLRMEDTEPVALVPDASRERCITLARECSSLLVGIYAPETDRHFAADLTASLINLGYEFGDGRCAWDAVRDEGARLLDWARPVWPMLFDGDGRPGSWLRMVAFPFNTNRRTEHVQLAAYLLRHLPSRRQAFGAGPWICRNPLAKHCGRMVVTVVERRRTNGKTIGRFRCACGYIYTQAQEDDGSLGAISFSRFGPLLRCHVDRAIKEGWTLTRTAQLAALDTTTLRHALKREGIVDPWNEREGSRRDTLSGRFLGQPAKPSKPQNEAETSQG